MECGKRMNSNKKYEKCQITTVNEKNTSELQEEETRSLTNLQRIRGLVDNKRCDIVLLSTNRFNNSSYRFCVSSFW